MIVLGMLLNSLAYADNSYNVGVFYFPGWRPSVEERRPEPWKPIRNYSGRIPLLGEYDDGDPVVLNQQLMWMKNYGIDFVVFDWYWRPDSGSFFEQSIRAFISSGSPKGLEFSLLWANHNQSPSSLEDFDKLVTYWISQYFTQPQYQRIDGKPTVYVFSIENLEQRAKALGLSTLDLLERARLQSRRAGLSGIFFVASSYASSATVNSFIPKNGYDAISAYNYHAGVREGKLVDFSHSYNELDVAYRYAWSWFGKNSQLPYFPPVTAGWDKRPWGGSSDKGHDNSSSSPESFVNHLKAARLFVDSYPSLTKRTVLVCCWNEFGEGSYIEPTQGIGFDYLRAIRNVFGLREALPPR